MFYYLLYYLIIFLYYRLNRRFELTENTVECMTQRTFAVTLPIDLKEDKPYQSMEIMMGKSAFGFDNPTRHMPIYKFHPYISIHTLVQAEDKHVEEVTFVVAPIKCDCQRYIGTGPDEEQKFHFCDSATRASKSCPARKYRCDFFDKMPTELFDLIRSYIDPRSIEFDRTRSCTDLYAMAYLLGEAVFINDYHQ